jgi:hypothetical protein
MSNALNMTNMVKGFLDAEEEQRSKLRKCLKTYRFNTGCILDK